GTGLTMGGTSVLNIDLSSLPQATTGSVVIAQALSWGTLGFTTVNINNPNNVTLARGPGKVSYVSSATGIGSGPLAGQTVKQIVLDLGATVTPVKLEGFAATAQGIGTMIEWTAISEFQNLGFNLYRRAMNEPRPQNEPRPHGR